MEEFRGLEEGSRSCAELEKMRLEIGRPGNWE